MLFGKLCIYVFGELYVVVFFLWLLILVCFFLFGKEYIVEFFFIEKRVNVFMNDKSYVV